MPSSSNKSDEICDLKYCPFLKKKQHIISGVLTRWTQRIHSQIYRKIPSGMSGYLNSEIPNRLIFFFCLAPPRRLLVQDAFRREVINSSEIKAHFDKQFLASAVN